MGNAADLDNDDGLSDDLGHAARLFSGSDIVRARPAPASTTPGREDVRGVQVRDNPPAPECAGCKEAAVRVEAVVSAWQEDLRERYELKKRLAEAETVIQQQKLSLGKLDSQIEDLKKQRGVQAAASMLRVRLAHQGETDATVKLNKAQRRVAELCTELTLAKRHIQHLTETETEVPMDLQRTQSADTYRSLPANAAVTLLDQTANRSHMSYYNEAFSLYPHTLANEDPCSNTAQLATSPSRIAEEEDAPWKALATPVMTRPPCMDASRPPCTRSASEPPRAWSVDGVVAQMMEPLPDIDDFGEEADRDMHAADAAWCETAGEPEGMQDVMPLAASAQADTVALPPAHSPKGSANGSPASHTPLPNKGITGHVGLIEPVTGRGELCEGASGHGQRSPSSDGSWLTASTAISPTADKGAPHKEAARKVLDMDSLSDNTADTYAYAKTQNKKQPWWQTLLGGCGAARFGLEDEE